MASDVVTAKQAAAPLPSRFRLEGLTLLYILLLTFVAFIVLYPIVLLAINSFNTAPFGQGWRWGLSNWQTALTQPRILTALQNTVTLTVTRQALALLIGVTLAWLLARTNLPGRNWLEMGFWFALLLPQLPILLGWILLLDGHYGVLINAIRKLPGLSGFQFEIFSWWGIIVAHLVINLIPLKVFLLTPAFRNIDGALEEAARAHGASTARSLFQIVFPLVTPAILFVTLLGIIRSMQSFEIELILGGAAKIDVYSTLMYRDIQQSPPRYGSATALAMVVLVAMTPFIVLQQNFINKRSYQTVSGKFQARLYDLGGLRWPIFAAVAGLVAIILVLPTSFMVLSSFMKVFGNFNVPEPWTTGNWSRVLSDPLLLKAVVNTLQIGFGAMLLSISLFTVIAYVSLRSKFFGRRFLNFLTWLPSTIPGIVTSLGLLWLFLGTPIFRPLYGTIWILILAMGISGITLGTQLIRSSLMQLGNELEEASWAAGAGWGLTMRRVLMPLMAPTIAIVGLQSFAAAVSAVSLIALLGSAANKPLSLLQLEYLDTGLFEPASVIGIMIFFLAVVAAVVARVISNRVGLARFGSSTGR
ncbi:MAG TPA: iron ABC transporter permease [Chloroflexota bacterium]|nr:iron ABC transporter permease [Chloroflexota bacterium]